MRKYQFFEHHQQYRCGLRIFAVFLFLAGVPCILETCGWFTPALANLIQLWA